MNKENFLFRSLTLMVITIILVLGMFRENIISNVNRILQNYLEFSNFSFITGFIQNYGSQKTISEWLSSYVIFYSIYLSFHFLLINLVFKNAPIVKKWVRWALILMLTLLILGKIIFGLLNVTILEEYFSFAFHKLIGLPFLLLAIEGGRSIYYMIDEKTN